jgi:hypothetical protein
MNAKRIAAAIALACILCMTGAAQAAKSSSDVPLISIENGYAFGYTLSTSNFSSSLDFSIGLGLTDKLQFYFTTLPGDGLGTPVFPAFRLFGLAYSIAPKIGVATIIGRNTTANAEVVGLGIFSNLLQRDIGDVSTALKLKLNYVAPMSDFTAGFVQTTISASIGI